MHTIALQSHYNYPPGHQAVLRGSGEGRVEVRHSLRLVRHTHDHPGSDLLQHQEEGGLVGQQDARKQLHRLRHARRDAAEGQSESPNLLEKTINNLSNSLLSIGYTTPYTGQHHGGVPFRRLPSSHRHRCVGQRLRCSTGRRRVTAIIGYTIYIYMGANT